MLMNCIKLIYRIALVLFLFTSLAINITMFAWQAGAQALSGAYSALSRTPAVITGFKQANDKLITSSKHLTTKVAGLTQENSKLLASSKHLTTKVAGLTQENSKLLASSKNLTKKVAGLTQENSKLLASNKRFKKKIDTNKRKVKQLSKKIVKRTWWRTGRNIAGVVPEAIPVVGIFAIVSLTALDIKDACDTMRDMKELNAQFGPDENAIDERDVCGVNVPSVSEVMAKVKSSPEDDYNKLNDDWNLNLPSWNDDWNLNLPSWKDVKKLLKGNDK